MKIQTLNSRLKKYDPLLYAKYRNGIVEVYRKRTVDKQLGDYLIEEYKHGKRTPGFILSNLMSRDVWGKRKRIRDAEKDRRRIKDRDNKLRTSELSRASAEYLMGEGVGRALLI